ECCRARPESVRCVPSIPRSREWFQQPALPSVIFLSTESEVSESSLRPLWNGVLDLQEQLLSGAIAGSRFERSQNAQLGLVELARRKIGLRQVEQRPCLVERAQGHDRGVFADGARVVVLLQPQVAEAAVQILVVHWIDFVDRVQRRRRFASLADVFPERSQLLERRR